MEGSFPLLMAALVGFGHAFEADHLLAISTLTARSKSTREVATQGIWWGLGHTSTILFMGLLLIVFQVNGLKAYFDYLEIFVGIMLIGLGGLRIYQELTPGFRQPHSHPHDREAYSIGLIHGLAGSGALILLVLTDLTDTSLAIGYLVVFGIGSAVGMSVAASILRLPIQFGNGKYDIRKLFTWFAGLLCIGYGIHILLRFI